MTDIMNEAMLEKFVVFFNQYQSQACTIILHTRGGQTYVTDAIVTMVNQMEDVTLIINAIYSAGFEFALRADCKKILAKTARGMWHLGRCDMSMAIDGKPFYDEDINHLKTFPIEYKLSCTLAKKIMTKDEFHKLKVKREEVWFDFKRMKQIFPDAEIMK